MLADVAGMRYLNVDALKSKDGRHLLSLMWVF